MTCTEIDEIIMKLFDGISFKILRELSHKRIPGQIPPTKKKKTILDKKNKKLSDSKTDNNENLTSEDVTNAQMKKRLLHCLYRS